MMEPICPKCKEEAIFLMYNEDEGGEIHMCTSCDWAGSIFEKSIVDGDGYFDDESIVDWGDF